MIVEALRGMHNEIRADDRCSLISQSVGRKPRLECSERQRAMQAAKYGAFVAAAVPSNLGCRAQLSHQAENISVGGRGRRKEGGKASMTN